MRYLLLIILALSLQTLDAQITRGELEKQTEKAQSFMDSGKIEDAVAIFNEILKKDPTEGKALLLRARAKYELSAFKGTKKDCFAYMDLYGIDAEVAGLLGKTEKALENYKQALAYLKTALLFDPNGIEYLLDRADIFYNLGLDEQACIDWHQAKLNGSDRAQSLSDRHCRQVRIPIDEVVRNDSEILEKENEEAVDDTEETDATDTSEQDDTENEDQDDNQESEDEDEDTVREDDETNGSDDDPEVNEEENYPLDTRVTEKYVDDELTILIADGIGSRKLVEMPDILILSDKSGEVVVDVCIDRLGRIVRSSLNEENSTLKTPSLVSLALRESSNFRFARSTRKEHCGTITFVITGS